MQRPWRPPWRETLVRAHVHVYVCADVHMCVQARRVHVDVCVYV